MFSLNNLQYAHTFLSIQSEVNRAYVSSLLLLH
jgi:hypothetical protein